MKYFSYTTKNNNRTKAISLENIRVIEIQEGTGKSVIRYSVIIHYTDTTVEGFYSLDVDEAKMVYENLVKVLNEA